MTSSPSDKPPTASRDFLGHPPGLAVLFATEAWERFSYFGNAALVVLYMVKYLFDPTRIDGVLGFAAVKAALEFVFGRLEPQPLASQLFGFYTGLAYFTPILGGLLADRVLGQRRCVVIGGLLMAAGHFMMAFEGLFLVALAALILGVGAFKPNISTQVGALYAPGDHRRDRAYSIFYLGINIGALLAPIVCGALAAQYGWHYGFGAAGVGMLVSLAVYLRGRRLLPDEQHPRRAGITDRPLPGSHPQTQEGAVSVSGSASGQQRRAVLALLAVCAPVALFWAAYDQQGNTLLLWTEDFTDRAVDLGFWRGQIPSSWFLALSPLMIFVFTPLIVRLWAWQDRHGGEPRPIDKMAFGCCCLMLANLLMAGAASGTIGKASALWLIGYFMLSTIGELHLAPVGLAMVTRIAPARILSMMMGVWFATTLPADILGGFLGGFWSSLAKTQFFLLIAVVAAMASVGLFALRRLTSNEP
jgi:POT family proton-dependent oligopeptide transporter